MIKQAPLSCRELVELVGEYLDGSMRRRERRRFDRHIGACPNCRRYLAQMRETIAATGRLREDDIDAEVRSELLEAFRGWSAAR